MWSKLRLTVLKAPPAAPPPPLLQCEWPPAGKPRSFQSRMCCFAIALGQAAKARWPVTISAHTTVIRCERSDRTAAAVGMAGPHYASTGAGKRLVFVAAGRCC